MKKLKIGLIGCGNMMSVHAKAVNDATGVEIVAVCDVIRENAEAVAAVLNNPFICTDYTELTDKVEAVMIALPHDLHYECGMYFASKGKHILMEKPLCNTEEECINLIRRCEEKGVVLMCAYPVRFWPGVVKLKELCDSGEYGKIIQMSIWTEQLTGINAEKDGKPSWLLTSRLGGGQFFSHGCHYIDVMLWFLGQPKKGIHIGTNVGTPWMLKEGTSCATLLFENGAIGYHGATWGARGTRLDYDFQIHTEKGMLEYEHASGEIRLYDGALVHKPGEILDRQKRKILWTRNSERSKQTQFEISHFAECIREGKRPLTDGESALRSLRVIWRMYDAEREDVIADLSDI